MTFLEWLQIGTSHGWCSEPMCGMHNGLPLTAEETERFDQGDEPCFTIIRLHGEQP